MIRELDVAQFMDVLRALDRKLGKTRIEIRAVGGFALAWRKVREKGLTADIDTITDDYPQTCKQLSWKPAPNGIWNLGGSTTTLLLATQAFLMSRWASNGRR